LKHADRCRHLVLLNFLRLHREGLLAQVPGSIAVTNHALDELTIAEQASRMRALITAGHIQEVVLDSMEEISLFAKLMTSGRLGAGECSALAHGILHGKAVALDDKRAIREGRKIHKDLQILTTADIIVKLIKAGRLTLADADAMKTDWAANHRFCLPIDSFQELLD